MTQNNENMQSIVEIRFLFITVEKKMEKQHVPKLIKVQSAISSDVVVQILDKMATAATGWYRGRVKSVSSGNCLVIMAVTSKGGPLPEKTITLSSLIAPRLARRNGIDEPFAWESREFLRKFCIGKEVLAPRAVLVLVLLLMRFPRVMLQFCMENGSLLVLVLLNFLWYWKI